MCPVSYSLTLDMELIEISGYDILVNTLNFIDVFKKYILPGGMQ